MKKLIFVFAILWSPLVAAEAMTVGVKGMVCAFCAQGIKKKVGELQGVASVDVSLEKKTVTVHTKDGESVDRAALGKALKDAGYEMVD